jgi:Tfp pilus assembly protein PilN
MINLLPDNMKTEIQAARTNVTLVKYIIVLCLGIVFLCSISAVVYFTLLSAKESAEAIIADNAAKSSSYNSVRTQANSLRSDLASVKTLLDQEVVYTKVITNIAKIMPSGVVLDALSLSPATLGTPTTFQVYAKTTEDALKLKSNLQQSSLFSEATFQSLTSSTQNNAAGYPITATLSVVINKSAAK